MGTHTATNIHFECEECGDYVEGDILPYLEGWIILKNGDVYCPDCYTGLT